MGVIIWQMLTLQSLPYAQEGRIMAVLEGVRDGTLDLRPSLPLSAPWETLSALAYRCLDPQPSRRPSCTVAMQVLDNQCHYARQATAAAPVLRPELAAVTGLATPLLSVEITSTATARRFE